MDGGFTIDIGGLVTESAPLAAHTLRLELYADGKLAHKQEILVPKGLTKKLAMMCAGQLLSNSVVGGVETTIAGLGFK